MKRERERERVASLKESRLFYTRRKVKDFDNLLDLVSNFLSLYKNEQNH